MHISPLDAFPVAMTDGPLEYRHSPQSLTDGSGREIRLEGIDSSADESAKEALVSMYLEFDGQCRAMGIPPVTEDDIREWVVSLLDGTNLLAWHADRVVGHAVLLPDGSGDHELAIFVHQDYQNAGIGTELLQTLLGDGQRDGAARIWLTVACGNSAAKRLFRSVGFEVVERSRRQLTMEFEL